MCYSWKILKEIGAKIAKNVSLGEEWTQPPNGSLPNIYPNSLTTYKYIYFIMFTIIQYIFMHIVVQNLLRLHHPSPNPNFPQLPGASHLHCSRCLILQLAAFASWATCRDLTQGPKAGPGGEARQLTSNQTKSMVGWFQESMDGVLL